MEGDTGQHSPRGTDSSSHNNELKLVNFDSSGEQASSPTCPLNLLVRSPLPSKTDLDLSDPFLIGTSCSTTASRAGGGGGDRPVPTDELVDFREKGSREADDSGRGEHCDLQLIGDDALEQQLSGEADMDNIFQEALALADRFSQLDNQDEADVSLMDSAPQSLPGENELLSLDSALLAALAEARSQQPPSRAAALPDSPLDSSFPAPTSPWAVSSLRSASAAAVAQVAQVAAGSLTPPGTQSRAEAVVGSGTLPSALAPAPALAPALAPAPAPAAAVAALAPAPAAAAVSRALPTRRLAPLAAQQPESEPAPAAHSSRDVADTADTPAAPAAAPAAATPRLAGRPRDSLAMAAGRRRLVAPAAATPPPADDAGYADLCQQASDEQRELERQADEEYENRQFEHLERRVSRDDLLESGSESEQGMGVEFEADTTDGGRKHPRSQLSRKETYICRPNASNSGNTGTFKIDKKQRFGTFKIDKTGTFKVPRAAASVARSLPPEPPPVAAPPPAAGQNGDAETPGYGEETRGDAPASGLSVDREMASASLNNTFCKYDDEYDERSPSPSAGPLSASTPERSDPSEAAISAAAAGRRAAALRGRPLTSTPCRSVGSSGSSIGITPIRGLPADITAEESPVPPPVAALRGAALRQPAAGLRQPGPALRQPAGGLRRPAASGLRQPAASGLKQPAASGLRQPAASGLRQPAASGLRQPAASGLRAPAASGLRPPSASGLRAPSAAGAPRSAPSRQTAAPLRQSSAQSGSDSSVCSVRSLPAGPNTSRSYPSLVTDRSDTEAAPHPRQIRQLPGPAASRLTARGGLVRRSAGGTGSLTNISLQASHSAAAGGLRRPATGRNRTQETSKLSLSQHSAGSERF